MSDKRAANALGGKTARACDGCVQKRARWYCAADDAFLCQSCDSSVHTANQLARRHERVRLETASAKLSPPPAASSSSSWHQGFTRKARTPRQNKSKIIKELNFNNPQIDPLVPEIGINSEEWSVDENYDEQQQQMLFRVPEFDPFEPELGNNIVNNEDCEGNLICEMEGMDLADFAADVESLIGVDQLLQCKLEEEEINVFYDEGKLVKVKDEESLGAYNCFDEDEEETKVNMIMNNKGSEITFLRLNYESVITAWENQGSPCPWTTGSRPQFNPHDFLSSNGHHLNGGIGIYSPQVIRGNTTDMDGEREARVSRYREKRRTRLFSKKIRYEVRKLNAEKRPRMKGRFVKRTPFMGTPLPN